MLKDRIKKGFNIIIRILSYISLAILVLIAFFLLFYILTSQYARLKDEYPLVGLYTIVSPSMEPNINVYDVIIDFKVKNEDSLKVGDIVTFYSEEIDTGGYTITHRIKEIMEVDGIKYYITKGDNNEQQDAGAIVFEDIVGRVYTVIPSLGKIQMFISSKLGWLLIILIPAIGIIIIDVMKLIKVVKIRKQIEVIPQIKEVEALRDKEENKKFRALIEKANKINKKQGSDEEKE